MPTIELIAEIHNLEKKIREKDMVISGLCESNAEMKFKMEKILESKIRTVEILEQLREKLYALEAK